VTRIALITTTINVPIVLTDYVHNCGYDLDVVVAGDSRTPTQARDFVENLGGTYLGINGELVERWDTHRAVGLHTIQRRNLALLHALTLGPDIIVTIDDDNTPQDHTTYFTDIVNRFERPAPYLTSSHTGWFDPGTLLHPRVVHRGFPIDQRHVDADYVTRGVDPTSFRVGVVAGLTLGDPDVDAIERIVRAPMTEKLLDEVTLDRGTWAPFNTQNTAYRWEVAPLMQCMCAVGRYDDIWMSYVARRVMDDLGWYVSYGRPLTCSVRNQHDLVTDLERELYGYRYTADLTTRLRDATDTQRTSDTTPLDCLEELYYHCEHHLKYLTKCANRAWLRDARRAVGEGQLRRRERSK
jgi:hypothetical protein